MTKCTFRWPRLLVAMVLAQGCIALSSGGDDVCYFDLVQGDACVDALTTNNVINRTADTALSSNQKDVACMADEIISVVRTDMEKLRSRPDVNENRSLRSRGRSPRQYDEHVQKFQVGDVVEAIAIETAPGPTAQVYYPSIIRGIPQEVVDSGGYHASMKYDIERLMDGFHATVPENVLRSYDKYEYGAQITFCRKRSTDPSSLPSSFDECKVMLDRFPDWIIDHSDPHTRVESFLNGHYDVVYVHNLKLSRDLREVHRVPAHDMFSLKYQHLVT